MNGCPNGELIADDRIVVLDNQPIIVALGVILIGRLQKPGNSSRQGRD